MGNMNSKFDEWRDISVRKQDNPTEFWEKVFRYGGGALGVTSSLAAFALLIKYVNNLGGVQFERPKFYNAKYFNWHILSMSASFLLLMAPSAVTFEVFPYSRGQNKNLHYYLNTLSLAAGALGLTIVIDNHQNLTKQGSFRSVHGTLGYGVMAMLLVNFLGGFLGYVLGKGGALRGTLKPLHKRLGMLTLLLGMTNIISGLMQQQAARRYKGDMKTLTHRIAFLVFLSFMGIYTAVNKFEDKSDPQ